METVERKGRTRIFKGKLTNFYELSNHHQKVFLTIKKVLCEILGDDTNVYVFGSFYWGFWDDESDYDVLLDYVYNGFKIDERFDKVAKAKEILKTKYNLKTDIITMKGELGILIP